MMRCWLRRRTERRPQSEDAPGRTLTDAEVHRIALGIALATAYVDDKPNAVATAEEEIRLLLAGLNAADLTEVCADVGAFSVWAWRVAGYSLKQTRDAFQMLALKEASRA
jgi:hypothetical protein